MCGVAPQQEKTSGKMTLNSPHLTLCGAGGRPAGLMCAHALTHTRPGQSPEASVATWRARIMTSIMSPYSEAEWERVAEEESEREEREHFPFRGCRSPIVARPAGAFSPRLQLIGCPAMWGWWLRGRGSGGAIATVKCPGRAGLRGLFFFLFGWFECCVSREVRTTVDQPPSLSFHHHPIDLFFSSLAAVTLLQFNMWFLIS